MTEPTSTPTGAPVRPPSRLELAVMIWLAVFPSLTVLNLVFGPLLDQVPSVVRTLIVTTVLVPIVVFLLLPLLQRARAALLRRRRR
jgi:antibiotic biosynthesis monooxygenase (ABM) superfamily enzyme